MELKLKIYEDRLCRRVKDEVKANDFGLSLGVCEEILNAVNIDLFAGGGFSALTDDTSKLELLLPIVREGLPYFKELLAEVFEVSESDMKNTDLGEIVGVIFNVILYALQKMKPFAEKGKNGKN